MKKAWHDPRNKEYGSDSNALRRLFESMELEDGYNKQVGKLMFRCADELERLHAVNAELVEALRKCWATMNHPAKAAQDGSVYSYLGENINSAMSNARAAISRAEQAGKAEVKGEVKR